MKIIKFDDIINLKISPALCYEWVSDLIKSKESTVLPAKISMKPKGMEGVFYNCMPSIIPDADCAGVKLVTRYPGREPSLDSQILLYKLSSGEHIALLDGNWITAMRTGAVAVHSIMHFAIKNFSQIGMIGLGNTARGALKVLLEVTKEKNFCIFLQKYKNQHEIFAQEFGGEERIKFVYCDSMQEVVSSSQVIISAVTVFHDDVCKKEWFQDGCLLVPIHTRGFSNCDLFFDKIYADDTNHVKGFKNFNKFLYFAEVSDVMNGKKEGRINNREKIIAYNIGISIHDIYFANRIAEMISNTENISMNTPKDKFWL